MSTCALRTDTHCVLSGMCVCVCTMCTMIQWCLLWCVPCINLCAVLLHRHYGDFLVVAPTRRKQALSLLLKTLRLRKETLGARHVQSLNCMVGVGFESLCVCTVGESS